MVNSYGKLKALLSCH